MNASTAASAGELPQAKPFQDPEPFEAEADGNHLVFYPRGTDRLNRLLELIEGAKKSIRMFYYLFLEDQDGIRVRDALVDAARRGVTVELMVDSFGSDANEPFFAPVKEAGGLFAIFISRWSTRYLIRNHQKIALFDDAIGMLGGFNISCQYFNGPERNGWNDVGMTIEGPAMGQLIDWFRELKTWTSNPKAQFRALRQTLRRWNPPKGKVQLLLCGPARIPGSYSQAVKRDIAYCSRLDLVMAYFSPPGSFRRLLSRAARRGRVRLIMAGKSDNSTTIGAARALYSGLLRCGAEIFEFQPCKMHTKLLVVDDVTYIGSSNFDMRSLRLNLELMLRIEDAALADKMRSFIDGYVPNSEEITLRSHMRERTWWRRIVWWASWFLVSVVDYTITRRLNLPE